MVLPCCLCGFEATSDIAVGSGLSIALASSLLRSCILRVGFDSWLRILEAFESLDLVLERCDCILNVFRRVDVVTERPSLNVGIVFVDCLPSEAGLIFAAFQYDKGVPLDRSVQVLLVCFRVSVDEAGQARVR